jgi:hypothetical protein
MEIPLRILSNRKAKKNQVSTNAPVQQGTKIEDKSKNLLSAAVDMA